MPTPLVSIIVPNYNHSRFLEQRLQSVFQQTYQNFEVIIFDDASTDNGASRAIIERFRDHPKVSHIVYNQQNSGSTFKQWERGIQFAKGEYCWIAESDDFCDLDLLERLIHEAESHPNVSVVSCRSQCVDEKGNPTSMKEIQKEDIAVLSGRDYIRQRTIYSNGIWNASSAIFRRSSALQIDPQYMNYRSAGDRLFWIELAEKGNVIIIKDLKNYYRHHQNNVTTLHFYRGVTYREVFNIIKYIKDRGYLSFLEYCRIRNYYIELIKKSRFDNETIRKELIKLWSYNGFFLIRLFHLVRSVITNSRIVLFIHKFVKLYKDFLAKKAAVYNSKPFLEVTVAEHCNLNCSGCAHFSPLASPKFIDIQQYVSDMSLLSKIEGIEDAFRGIQLMGGEPLLYDRLQELCAITRRLFPSIPINVVTNGILIKQQTPDFWKCLSENKITLKVSAYPINLDYNYIQKLAQENNVHCVILHLNGAERHPWRHYSLEKTPSLKRRFLNYVNCREYGHCVQYLPGRIIFCFICAHSHFLNETFGIDLKLSNNDSIEIAKIKTFDNFKKWLAYPHSFCKYCNLKNTKNTSFGLSQKAISEWMDDMEMTS